MENDQKFNKWNNKLKDKKAELEACENELEAIIEKLIDSKANERKEIIAKRLELLDLKGLLQDEAKALQRRRNLEYIAMYQEQVNIEEAELDKLATMATEKKAEMDQAINAVLHFINRPARGGETQAAAREKVKLETEKARTMAESRIARQEAERQKNKLREAKEALEAAINSL
jgi:hypothetical protein